MKEKLERKISFLIEDLNERKNHVLLYGEPEVTSKVLRTVYEKAKEDKKFLCTWHDSSKITKPLDFFEPILKAKYGKEYSLLKFKSWFKNLKKDKDIFYLSSLCGQEENSNNKGKLPIFFIDGIEELFFKMDYAHLDDEELNKVLTKPFMEQPLSKGFGNHLRAHLHQTGKGIFYGTIKNPESMEYKTTLGNYHYLFYNGNFWNHMVDF